MVGGRGVTPTKPIHSRLGEEETIEELNALGPSGADGLNPRYAFETFVKGASNQFALAAALRVAETPARSYNPLFIYGAAGLGKTHLLHAIGHYVSQNYAHYQVRYVSTETFLNEYVDAIRTSSTAMFKRRYRDVDVLLIDDIQFMEGKEGLQDEFFHTFNSLHGANKQIVISSDPCRYPSPRSDRLRGRFKWTHHRYPATRSRDALAICATRPSAIAAPCRRSARVHRHPHHQQHPRARRCLIRVSAYASLNRVPVTIQLAEHLLGDMLSDNQPRVLTSAIILDTVSDYFGFTVEALKGKSRQRPLVTARQIGMYVFRELTDLSFPAIAREFGGRDHTTVIHAVEKIQRLYKERQSLRTGERADPTPESRTVSIRGQNCG
jgi:chromosomal replication initiator protein